MTDKAEVVRSSPAATKALVFIRQFLVINFSLRICYILHWACYIVISTWICKISILVN